MTTNNDLNVGLARLMGREVEIQTATEVRAGGEPRPVWWPVNLPNWAGSLDALFAPGGPVEYARSKGIECRVHAQRDGRYRASATTPRGFLRQPIFATDPAEALATALHEAFMKEQGQ